MATYKIVAPDGNTYRIEGPEGATNDQVVAALLAKYPQANTAPTPEGGFVSALKANLQSLKGETALTAGKLGLMGLPEAEKYRAEREEEAKRIFKPTEKGWTEAPGTKIAELLGGSIPYMAAPIAAGLGALALPVALPKAAIGAGLAGLASATQFTGSNLARQLEEAQKRGEIGGLGATNLGTAAAAAVPQAALDVFSLRGIPLVRNLFKSVGKDLTEAEAKAIVEQGIRKTAADYAMTTGKVAGREGTTEAGQQFFERLQAGLNIADKDAREEYLESFVGGAVLGGVISPAGRFVERVGERGRAEELLLARDIERETARLQEESAKKAKEEELKKQRLAKISDEKLKEMQDKVTERETKIADLQARADAGELKGHEKAQLGSLKKYQASQKEKIDAALAARTPEGAPDVGQTITEPSGEGFEILEKPPTVGGAQGVAGTQPSGVVPTGADAGPAVGGEGAAPSTVVEGGGAPVDQAQQIRALSDKELQDIEDEIPFAEDDSVRSRLAREELARRGVPTLSEQKKQEAPAVTGPTGNAAADLAALNNLLSGADGLPSRGTAKATPQQQADIAKLNAFGNAYGIPRLPGELNQAYGERIKQVLELSQPTQEAGKFKFPGGPKGIDEEQARLLYDETREEFNKTAETDAKLPTYRELTDYERRLYFQGIARNDQTEHDRAAKALSNFLLEKRGETRAAGPKDELSQLRQQLKETTEAGGDTTAIQEEINRLSVIDEEQKEKAAFEVQSKDVYNRERGAAGSKTSINYSFPMWHELSDTSRQAFMAINKNNSAQELDQAFRALKNQIRKEKAELQSREAATEAEAKAKAEQRVAIEQALKKEAKGKGEPLPPNIIEALQKGDLDTALRYLSLNGQGLKGRKYRGPQGFFRVRDSVAREVFRNLAGNLLTIPGFKVNFVYDENLGPLALGEYDANTNTVYVGPRGLDEATLLHELVHAATVKIIHQYFVDKSKLTPRAREAVEHIQQIAAYAKKELGAKYPNAFDNLYEFVSYAMTDMDFQFQLAQIQVPRLEKFTRNTRVEFPEGTKEARETSVVYGGLGNSIWDYFTDTLAYLYKLFTPTKTKQTILMPVDTGKLKTGLTAESVKALRQREEDRKNRLAAQRRAKKQAEEAGEEVVEEEVEEEGAVPQEVVDIAESRKKEKEARLEDEAEIEIFGDSDITEKDEQDAEIAPEPDELVIQRGLTNLRRGILREPGYRGNLLLEFSAAFKDILAAPEGDIKELAGKEQDFGATLASRGAAATVTAPPAPQKTPEEAKAAYEREVAIKPGGAQRTVRALFTNKGYNWLVERFQNDRYILRKLTNLAERFGILNRLGDNINDVYGQITRSTGIAVHLFARYVQTPSDAVHKAVEAYAKAANVDINKALEQLHLVLEARHEPERRTVKFLRDVKLDKDNVKAIKFDGKEYSAWGFREEILKRLINPPKNLTPQQQDQRAKQYRDYLNRVVFKTDASGNVIYGADGLPQVNPRFTEKILDKKNPANNAKLVAANEDIRNDRYNVIAKRSPSDIAEIRRLFDKPELKAQIDAVSKAIKDVHEVTIALNREANYWSQPVQNIVNFYGFQNYVPFKGKPGTAKANIDDEYNLDNRRIGGEFQEGENAFEGRLSEADNPILQTLADGARAAMRAGRKELTLAIKNAAKDKIVNGKVIKTIKFEDRYLNKVDKKALGGPNKIFHYNADGTIDIIQINDKQQSEAIRRSYRVSQPLLDYANTVTSFIGQTHTRYNPAFAPMDYVRNSLTNAFNLGAELGPVKAGRLLTAISSDVASGGMFRTANYMRLYGRGKFDEIKRLAGGNKPYNDLTSREKYYRDQMEYVELGGKVSYLQGIAAKGALDGLMKEIGESSIVTTKRQVDRFFDAYNEFFELSNRVSTYRMLKQQFITDGMVEEDAKRKAAEYTKNLANFEQVGRYGKEMGALFMFFRPAATGAVRAIEALAPAFGFNERLFRAEAAARGRTPEQIERAVADMKRQQTNARYMAAGMVGVGISAYMIALMMSGDDEQGRNRVSTDDMARWTRYARFPVPGTDKFFQIPWGFGMGAFAAAGAQLASLTSGRVELKDTFSNIIDIGFDSYVPLPLSRISAVDNMPAKVLDSVTPSALRPFFEYVMNLDGLGREIYNNRQSRYGDAYTGGDNIPEIYKSITRSMFDSTTGEFDVSPNTLYFFATNFADGFAKIASMGYNASLWATGQKDFEAKTDFLPVGAFVGTRSNVDAREFSKLEDEIKGYQRQINSIKTSRPEMLDEYIEKNPSRYFLVEFYEQEVNGSLRDLRALANQVRANPELSPRDRKIELDELRDVQNLIKQQLIDTFKDLKKEIN